MTYQPRLIVELHEKEFVFAIGGSEESGGRFGGLLQFGPHAAARVQQKSDRNRRFFDTERRDLLLGAIFQQTEVTAAQSVYGRANCIGDMHRNEDK